MSNAASFLFDSDGRKCVWQAEMRDGSLRRKVFVMKLKKLSLLILPLGFAMGCATHREVVVHEEADGTVLAPTSSGREVRVYANPDGNVYETTPRTSMVPPEEWNTAMGIRNMVASDGYLKGACRHVDIEVIRSAVILRGRVLSEYDRHEIEARIAATPGVASVDNRLVVAGPP